MTPNPREGGVWWAVGRATVGTLVKTAFRLRVAGAGNVPESGGALLAYNHISVLDALFVALPIIERGRAVHFFVLSEDFERPIVGWGLRKTGQIPIRRGFGDWSAIETSAGVLKGGMLAGIAPEGTIGEGAELLPGQKGAARIALMGGAPVIPVGLWGTQRRWPKSGLSLSLPVRPTVAVFYGEPIHTEGDPKRRPDVQALTDRIMEDIAGLVAQARRGSQPAPHSSPGQGAEGRPTS
ncbi:MAG: 1-acyl-sn-glycerol-3-phosphate acyltransferase [Actinobacteria bacterium]|nr:MAG: 1-acyl-sn-glycerol-3-phosphate acyltransferase [Actinomycetota bacterium]